MDETKERVRHAGPASPSSPRDASPRQLADGVRLAGPMVDAGYENQQWLIAREGEFLQVSELIYRVAEQVDSSRTDDEIADRVTEVMPFAVTAEHISRIVETKLAPLGIVDSEEDSGAVADRSKGSGPLRVSGRLATVGPNVIEPFTRVLKALFHPLIAVPLLCAIVAAHVWLYLGHGLGGALVELIERPLLIAPLFAIIVAAGIFHEFGHAAALHYGGGRCRSMGFGFYLIYPALYTDTSDAYRLGRWARIRTDLGGFYFHQLFALGLIGLSLATGQTIWLLAVLIIDLEMLRQLLFPFVRFDGYWLLSDLTGIPDLYTHFGAIAQRRFGRGRQADPPVLRAWPRRVFTVYAALAVPVLLGLLVLFIMRAPSFLRVVWESAQRQADVVVASASAGDVLGVVVAAVQILLLSLPVLGGIYLICNLALMVRRVRRSMSAARLAAANP